MLFHDVIFISFLTCCFRLSPLLCCSGGKETNPISCDAEGSAVKDELEGLSSIATVHAFRTPLDIVGGMHLDNFISTPRHVPGLRWCGSPHIMAYKLTASDVDPHSQILETGRQYRFQVRAINNCDTDDPSRSCFGEFSEVQIFTVRDPRAPLPPLMPLRDAGTRVISSNEASITISWTPPITNSGSPIICTARLRRNYPRSVGHLLQPSVDMKLWI